MQYNSYQNPYMFNNSIPYRVMPISNIEEVNRTPVDFNGSPTYFHNQTNNEIYVKQFDVRTGLSNLQVFKRQVETDKDINPYERKFEAINQRLDALAELFDKQEEKNANGNKKSTRQD